MQSAPILLPSWTTGQRAIVGVCPTPAFHQRRRLFRALERVLPVQFEPRPDGEWRGLQAAILFGADAGFMEQVSAGRMPAFIVEEQSMYSGEARQMVRFTDAGRLDCRLRGQQVESLSATVGFAPDGVDHVDLATTSDRPLWCTSRTALRVDHVAVSPAELESGESLRDHLRGGRYLQLLPLLEFLRELTGQERGERQVRATFIIDDPNLHWSSYGYVDFRSVAAHARAGGYHVTFATVPLDCWFAWPGAARIFRTNNDVLSLTSHGAYHFYSELLTGASGRVSPELFEDAAARLDRFARWSRVPVSRVMVPPHGTSALSVHGALVGAGFEALCTTLGWWADWPRDQASIAGMAMADVSPAGLPVFARHCLPGRFVREDALISAYLGQPVVLYGHPQDLADGYDLLERTASWLRSVSAIVWVALEEIARTNVITHFDVPSATLHLRVLNRRCRVMVPPGARIATIEGSGSADAVGYVRAAGAVSRVHATGVGWQSADQLPCQGGQAMEVIIGDVVRDHARGRPTAAPLRAYARRAAVETRDRLRPILRRLRLEPLTTTVEEAFRDRRREAAFHAQRRRAKDAAG